MTRLYLIRHGETDHNAKGIVQGTTDTNLNEKGLLQAQLVAARLKDENIHAIYSSSLSRAKETAIKISEQAQMPVNELHDCREICLGPWQGLTIDQIKENYGEHYRLYVEQPSDFNLPGAETFLQVAERFCRVINQVVSENKDKNIVIVSHGAAIKAAIITILGMDISYYTKFRIDNASISVLNFSEKLYGGVVVHCMNDINHLRVSTQA